MSRTLKIAWGSLAVSVVVAMKYAAYWLTGSVARPAGRQDAAERARPRAVRPWPC